MLGVVFRYTGSCVCVCVCMCDGACVCCTSNDTLTDPLNGKDSFLLYLHSLSAQPQRKSIVTIRPRTRSTLIPTKRSLHHLWTKLVPVPISFVGGPWRATADLVCGRVVTMLCRSPLPIYTLPLPTLAQHSCSPVADQEILF